MCSVQTGRGEKSQLSGDPPSVVLQFLCETTHDQVGTSVQHVSRYSYTELLHLESYIWITLSKVWKFFKITFIRYTPVHLNEVSTSKSTFPLVAESDQSRSLFKLALDYALAPQLQPNNRNTMQRIHCTHIICLV